MKLYDFKEEQSSDELVKKYEIVTKCKPTLEEIVRHEVKAVKLAFKVKDIVLLSKVKLEISEVKVGDIESTSVVIRYQNHRDDPNYPVVFHHWTYNGIKPVDLKRKLEQALKGEGDLKGKEAYNVEEEQSSNELVTNYLVSRKRRRLDPATFEESEKRVYQELKAIEKAFGAEQRVVGSEVSLRIKPASSAEAESTSVIVKYQSNQDKTEQWTTSSELAFEGIAASDVKQELKEALKNHHDYAITKQQEDGLMTNFRISQDDWKKR